LLEEYLKINYLLRSFVLKSKGIDRGVTVQFEGSSNFTVPFTLSFLLLLYSYRFAFAVLKATLLMIL
jgi:hypothetical protein